MHERRSWGFFALRAQNDKLVGFVKRAAFMRWALLLLFFRALFSARGRLLFFHLLADFFFAFGLGIGSLRALGLNDLFAAEQLDEAGLSAVTCAPSLVDDTQVSAVAVAEAWRDMIKKAVNRFARHQIAQ